MTDPANNNVLTEQAEYWVVRLASGEVSDEELSAFKTWLAVGPAHRAAFDRARGLWKALEGQEATFALRAPKPRRRDRPAWIRRAGRREGLAAVAAAAALTLLGPDALTHIEADHISATGQIQTIALPDGSTAMLDSDSAIAVRFGPAERRIRLLRGQAWFNVRHGDARPFRVAALGGVTRDVGTAFEVSRSTDAVTVAVTQGEVRVASSDDEDADGESVRALQRVRYPSGGAVERLTSGNKAGIAAWRHGLIVMDGRTVSEAIAEVARYRSGYTFTFADTSAAPKVSGVFRTAAPDEALAALARMAGLHMATLPGGIAILRR